MWEVWAADDVEADKTNGSGACVSCIISLMNDIEKLDALGREYGLFLYAVHRCKDGWGAQWRQGDENSLPYDYFTVYPTITAMVKAETDRIVAVTTPPMTFSEPITVETFMRVRAERYADMLRQIRPKHKSAEVV